MLKKAALGLFLGLIGVPTIQTDSSYACGIRSDCNVGDRAYRVRMPDGHNGTDMVGAIVFAHGYKGNAAGIVGSKDFAAMAARLGIAIIAGKSVHDAWALPGAPSQDGSEGIDDLAYFDAVIEDATSRFPIDPDRLMATGFSAGGMMIWELACHRSQSFAAFAPMAGTFWRPTPMTCTTPPTSIIHVHGDNDYTVPLNGRPVRDAHQGRVSDALDMYVAYGGFELSQPENHRSLECESRTNGEGEILKFCLFEGGHSFRTKYITNAWDMFVASGKL
jgi:polyhydroxybutyrate depolymerase